MGVKVKHTILKEYKEYLGLSDLQKTTVNSYYNKMDHLLEGQNFLANGKDVEIPKVLDQLATVKYKSYFSGYKNAFFYYLKCFELALIEEQKQLIRELQANTKKKYRKSKTSEYKKINATVQRLKNRKLKLSFLTIIETGLRVFELSQIKVSDCIIDGGSFNGETSEKIQFTFTGKGGKEEKVFIDKDVCPNLYKELEYIIKHRPKDEKLFYSANYLQKQAKKYGFTCLTLRQIYAKKEYRRTKSKRLVKERLRHDSVRTTNKYLNSRVNMD